MVSPEHSWSSLRNVFFKNTKRAPIEGRAFFDGVVDTMSARLQFIVADQLADIQTAIEHQSSTVEVVKDTLSRLMNDVVNFPIFVVSQNKNGDYSLDNEERREAEAILRSLQG